MNLGSTGSNAGEIERSEKDFVDSPTLLAIMSATVVICNRSEIKSLLQGLQHGSDFLAPTAFRSNLVNKRVKPN